MHLEKQSNLVHYYTSSLIKIVNKKNHKMEPTYDLEDIGSREKCMHYIDMWYVQRNVGLTAKAVSMPCEKIATNTIICTMS